jgi:hypothetical protein
LFGKFEIIGILKFYFRVVAESRTFGIHNHESITMTHTNKTKAYEEIARLFNISNESAKYFLNHVQKSFKLERPPHKLILEFAQGRNYGVKPAPYDVAAAMKESGVWDFAITSPPQVPEDEEDVYG